MSILSKTYVQLQGSLQAPLTDEDFEFLFTKCDLPFIKYFFEACNMAGDQFTLLAAQYNNIEALRWALDQGHEFDVATFIKTVREKENIDVIDAIAKTPRFAEQHLDLAIAHDKPLLVARILQQLGRKWSDQLTVRALKAGAWELLKSVYTIDQFKSFPMPGEIALPQLPSRVPMGALPVLPGQPLVDYSDDSDDPDEEDNQPSEIPAAVQEWVRVNGVPTSFTAYQVAARGRLDVLEHFFPQARGCGKKVWSTALRGNHLEILYWLHQSRPENPDFNKEVLIRRANKLGRSDIVGALTMQ